MTNQFQSVIEHTVMILLLSNRFISSETLSTVSHTYIETPPCDYGNNLKHQDVLCVTDQQGRQQIMMLEQLREQNNNASYAIKLSEEDIRKLQNASSVTNYQLAELQNVILLMQEQLKEIQKQQIDQSKELNEHLKEVKKQQQEIQKQQVQQIDKLSMEHRMALNEHRKEVKELHNALLQGIQKVPTDVDCAAIKKRHPSSKSGVYTITIHSGGNPFQVYCDMDTTGGGWTVFQRRIDGSENFYRPWADYVRGFGNLPKEFWMGNDHLASLTAARQYKLRVDLRDGNGYAYAEYSLFKVSNSNDKYRLTLGTYNGNAGDSLTYHNGHRFSTYDQDNDLDSSRSCANTCRGAWWYYNCHYSSLNGVYNGLGYTGISWAHWRNNWNSMRFSEMKIRPVTF